MAADRKTNEPVGTPFDRTLELREPRRATEAYASRHGEVGSAEYCAAWLNFRQRIKSIHDLHGFRAKAARAKPRRDTPPSPAGRTVRPRRVAVPRSVPDRPPLPQSAGGARHSHP